MHRRHRQSRVNNLLYTGPHFWFLANASGREKQTFDSIYSTRYGSIRVDNVTHGSARVSGQFSEDGGGGNEWIGEHHSVHRRPTGAHRITSASSGDPERAISTIAKNRIKGEPGKMRIRISQRIVPRIQTHTQRDTAR